jgi:predicted nucleic acid-binding protein
VRLDFDTSVWVDHLRAGALEEIIPAVRGRFSLRFDSVVAAELRAGCRTKRERRIVARVIDPFERSGRLVHPLPADFKRAAGALSRLREAGRTLKSPGGALLDAIIAAVSCREGALLVSSNVSDFRMLSSVLPLQTEGFGSFCERLAKIG